MTLYEQVNEILGKSGAEPQEIKKGIRTVIVPPSSGKKGYQYQRNFPDNKRENSFNEKEKKDSQSVTLGKLLRLMKDIASKTSDSDRKEISQKKIECSLSFQTGKYPAIQYHESRSPFTNKISPQDAAKRQREFSDAYFLARKGFRVYLPKEKNEAKSYDAIINDMKFEFKNIGGTLETVKKQYQAGLHQASGIVLFFPDRKSPDYMRYAAMMNGATNTSKNKTVTIICFEKENEIDFFDMRNVLKKSGVDQKPTPKAVGAITSHAFNVNQKFQSVNKSIQLDFVNITPMNSRAKLEKAVHVLARTLGVPVEVVKKENEEKGEAFAFKAQEELTYKWCDYFSQSIKEVYQYVIQMFGLPESNVVQKAGELRHKGQILYSPETGKPIKKSDWDNFVKGLEKLLNKKFGGAGKKITLDSRALGRLLDRMLKYSKLPEVKDVGLSDIKYSGRTFDTIAESQAAAEKVLGAEKETARIALVEQSAAERITGMTDRLKSEVKQTLIDGIKSHKSTQQVSQDLFNRLAGTNRDFRKIADTEIQNNLNSSFLAEETKDLKDGEKAYFQRMEIIDGATCNFCRKMNGVIAVWSNTPLANDKVANDPYATVAIWDGKDWNGSKNMVATGVFHPYCYSDDTEVMTDNGWKLFKDVERHDKIMSINPDTKEIDFIPFVQKIEYEYNGKMIHFPGRNFDLLVTPDHNMLYAAGNGHGERHLKGITASELIKRNSFSVPRGVGEWKAEDVKTVKFGGLTIRKSQYLRLWAWYLAEGSGRTIGGHYEVKLAQKDPMKIYSDLPDLQSVLHVCSDAVYLSKEYARYFECMFGIYADKKFIPHFIKNSSAENIREFLDAFSLADGTKNINKKAHEKAYAKVKNDIVLRTSSKQMADDLCELIVKAGWMPSVKILNEKDNLNHFANGDYVLNTDCYNIGICKSKYRTYAPSLQGHKPRHNPEQIDYKGTVYDVELEKWHFLLVRRNGKCAWSGNCRGIWVRWSSRINAYMAFLQKKNEQYNKAVDTARAEFKAKGIENPNDKTKGYLDRIDELYSGDIQKSLTWSGHELQDRYTFAGLKISIENKKGSVRSGTDKDGHEWHTYMNYDYGYIRGTEGVDGDHVDCYIGGNENAKNVYIVHQNDPVTHKYDEDKCMLGFDTLEEAKKAYLKQYDRPGFLGDITTMGIDDFKKYVLAKKHRAGRISP